MTGPFTSNPSREAVDFRDPTESENAYRIAFAWRELRRGASTSAVRDYFYGAADDALEAGQVDTLDLLVRRPDGWRMSELAEALRVDPSTATRAVQRLVNDGLAERRPCIDDGRVVLVHASPDGARRYRAVAKRRAAAMRVLLSAFDARERALLADLLERFVGALDELVHELNRGHLPESCTYRGAAASQAPDTDT